MSQLEIHIPEQWPDDANARFAWQMRNPQGAPQRSGTSPLGKIPPADKTFLILPAARVQIHTVRPPTKNRKKFMQALAYSLEDRIMAEPSSVHVAPGQLMENGDLPVAIIDKTWLGQILEHLQAAGIRPDGAEAETLLISSPPDGVWNMVWQSVSLFNRCYVRSGAFSGFELDGGTLQSPPPAIGISAQKPSKIQLYSASPEPDAAAWSQATGIPIFSMGEPVFIPCGLDRRLDLLQGYLSRRSQRPDWFPLLRTPLKLALAALLLHVGLTVTDWGMLKYEKSSLNTEMEHSFRSSFPDAKAIVNAPLQMRHNLETLRSEAGQISSADYLPLLARIAPHLGNQASILRIEYQSGKLQLNLILPEADIQILREKLPDAQIETGSESGNHQTVLTLTSSKE
jgi:general secretion pathway protein L